MPRFLAALLMHAAALSAFAAGPPLQDFCSPFDGKDCVVIWDAPTNVLPSSVAILKVVPTKFSASTVSNLLQMAGLTEKNKKRPVQEGVFLDKDVFCYGDKSETRYVGFVPSQGFITFYQEGIVSGSDRPVGVPTDDGALKLALVLLPKIGISKSELATGPDGKIVPFSSAAGSQMFLDKPSGKVVTNVVDRTILLNRQIGGIPVSGPAGISMKFGNEGKLAYMTAVCRATKPDGECPVPGAAEFIKRIKSGKALIRNDQLRAYKKLTVTKASLYYWEQEGSERQSIIYPFAILDAKTDQGGQNVNVQLFVRFANE